MANRYRGEIDAELDGTRYRLCLTLGALAELEDAFGDGDMLALAERFEKGRLSARDAVRIIGAGLRGAGHDVGDKDVARMRSEKGAAGFVDIVARLLAATFAGAGNSEPPPPSADAAASDGAGRNVTSEPWGATGAAAARGPFPGPR